ncbi:MAG: hypothetical protein WAK82_18715 [Streptosporangiaceae bacterium]
MFELLRPTDLRNSPVRSDLPGDEPDPVGPAPGRHPPRPARSLMAPSPRTTITAASLDLDYAIWVCFANARLQQERQEGQERMNQDSGDPAGAPAGRQGAASAKVLDTG